MLDRKEAKEIAQFVLKELRKSSYAYSTDARFDYRKTGMGRAKGGTIGQIGPEYQHYVCDVVWTSTGEDTIEWSAGSIKLADGRSQSLNSGGVTLEGTSLNYFWAVIGNPEIQTSTNYYDGVGDDKALLAFATKAPENDQLALVFPFFGTEPTFNSDVLSANMVLAAHIKAGVITASHIQVGSISADRLSFSAFDKSIDDLDDVSDGATYGRILTTDIQAGHIKLSEAVGSLDDIANGTYSKVLTTDISSGHIKLDTVITGTYGLVLSTDIQSGHIKLSTTVGSLDDIGDGSTYQRVRATQIDSGYLKLTSSTVKSSEWYNESGVEIDASHGINIYGTNNALTTRATKTGTIQCSVNSSGEITAGAGKIILNSTGIHVYGSFLKIYNTSLDRVGTITGDASGLVIDGIYSPFSQVKIVGNIYNTHGWTSDCDPDSSGGYDLGGSGTKWKNIYGTLILSTTYYSPVIEGMLCMEGGGGKDLYIYSSGAWRTNA